MTTYRDRHLAGLTSSDDNKRAKAEAKVNEAAKKLTASKTATKK